MVAIDKRPYGPALRRVDAERRAERLGIRLRHPDRGHPETAPWKRSTNPQDVGSQRLTVVATYALN
jgi:hypothetical protein